MGFFDRFRQQDNDTIKAEKLTIDDEADVDVDADIDEPDEFEKEAPADRETAGPFDVDEAPEGVPVIDFGALRVPARPGMGIRVEFREQTQAIVAIAIDLDGSSLQLQPFAAPRSSGIWGEVREQLLESMARQGAEAEVVDSPVGKAVVATIGKESAKQRTIKFLGVDGPRWFVRGVVSGPAARDEALLEQMVEVFRSVVVNRGSHAAPPRELLPMQMPDALAQQMQARQQAGGSAE
ncbi:DUF3710 domain-containing protein [Gulosibacter bifidus]|uniref:DUF3710 domain-containing protein n=1 Tax=Gulosibacter bifidus TaxID=272239 RepID=A0ABW5RFF4_9MICO|nr:DUF3710 domain-containing protein [Gulosibacter bifidus]